jgi:homoserine O-succinyltransferase
MSARLHSMSATTTSQLAHQGDPIVIALVNNMPDAALQTTETQFGELLRAAGDGFDIRLRLFSFPELIRSESGRAYVAEHYESIDRLWERDYDALIVTGAEPRTAQLSDEAYWPSLTRLADLAMESGTPTVWSCLAAHAAILYLDGIERRPVGEKLSGVFSCKKTREHALTAGLPAIWRMPHSRHNTLDAAALATAGYEILSFSEEAGADTFLLERQTTLVFFQGHPEYDVGALFREYRRDVGRFLSGTMNRYPEAPRGYFDDALIRKLDDFRVRAHSHRSRELLAEFPMMNSGELPTCAWHDTAVRLYTNWLTAFVSRTDFSSTPIAGDPRLAARLV